MVLDLNKIPVLKEQVTHCIATYRLEDQPHVFLVVCSETSQQSYVYHSLTINFDSYSMDEHGDIALFKSDYCISRISHLSTEQKNRFFRLIHATKKPHEDDVEL